MLNTTESNLSVCAIKENAPDIYFTKEYARLYETIEHGMAETIEVHNEHGSICSQVIKREIPIRPECQSIFGMDNKHYYDLVTPYGYGGPVIMALTGDKSILLKSFEEAMEQYVEANNIVSEFVRFHPLFSNGEDFKTIYDTRCIRHTVGTSLEQYEDPVQHEFSKECRKNIRQGLKRGLSYKVVENPGDLSSFEKIYYSTMKRNQASAYYYFPKQYFQKCLECFGEHMVLIEAIYDGQVIAAGLNFIWNGVIHTHLSGTLEEYLYLSPEHILQYALTVWGKSQGYRLIHHGGGRTDNPQDSLYLFKQKFGQHIRFDFYVGRKIWDKEIYKCLCNVAGIRDTKYFPAYRAIT